MQPGEDTVADPLTAGPPERHPWVVQHKEEDVE